MNKHWLKGEQQPVMSRRL